MPNPHDYHRPWKTPWALILYLLSFGVLVAVISHYYLIPAMRAFGEATTRERKLLSASSLLLMSVVLFILGVGLLLTFRVSRFFFPRPSDRRRQTRYVDAWAEAGRRMEAKEEENE
jgi:hypothetical protein